MSPPSPPKNKRTNTTMRNMKCVRILSHNNFVKSTRKMSTTHILTQFKCLPIDLTYLVVFWIVEEIVVFSIIKLG